MTYLFQFWERVIALTASGSDSADPVERLLQALNGTDISARRDAVEAIGRLELTECLADLVKLKSTCLNHLVRNTQSMTWEESWDAGYTLNLLSDICDAMARLDRSDTHAQLKQLCLDDKLHHSIRACAIESLCLECNYFSTDLILTLLRDDSDEIRLSAMRGLFRAGGFRLERFVPVIAELVSDPCPDVVACAAYLLVDYDSDLVTEAYDRMSLDNRYSASDNSTISDLVRSLFPKI